MDDALDRWLPIARDVEARGWSCHDGLIDAELVAELLAEARRAYGQGDFHRGAVGSGAGRAVRPQIRSDEIWWLAAHNSPALARLAGTLEALRLVLNRELQLGLFDHEAHFARYAPGAFYARHLDQPAISRLRILSAALYLNPDWLETQGGAMRLYVGAGQVVDVLPRAGRLAIFLSDRFEHEVLPATRERWSLTIWFLGRG